MARPPYGGAAYGGSSIGLQGIPAGALYVPGYSAYFYWQRVGGTVAYGQAAYGGASPVVYPSAGLLAAPDPANGTVTIQLWWAFATAVQVSRLDADGNRTPLRTSPVIMPTGSRRNYASNPKARDDLSGYAAGANTSLTRLTGQTTPASFVTTGMRMTAAAAGSTTMTLGLDTVTPLPAGYGFWLKTSAAITDMALSVTWYDVYGASLGARTYSVATAGRAAAVGQWSWCTLTMSSWPDGAIIGYASLVASGVATGGTVDVTGRMTMPNTLSGDYFDGDAFGASWVGTVGLGYSDISPIAYTVDAECPLDQPVQYQITSSAVGGYAATSQIVTLPSRFGTQAGVDGDNPWSRWLTHPAYPNPVKVWVQTPPTKKRTIERGIFPVMDSPDPIVVTGAVRQASAGTIAFYTTTAAARKQLRGMLSDGQPVLLRAPGDYGDEDSTMWVSLGDEVEDQISNSSYSQNRGLTYDFTQVSAPAYAVS